VFDDRSLVTVPPFRPDEADGVTERAVDACSEAVGDGRMRRQVRGSRASLVRDIQPGLEGATRRAERMTMWRMQGVVGIVVGGLLLAAPALGQELKAVGQIRSSGPVTSDASRKLGSQLRGLIAHFDAIGIVEGSAATVDAATRVSSSLLQVDATGRVQVYVSVTDVATLPLDILRRHFFEVELVNKDFAIVQGWIPVWRLEALAAEPFVRKVRPADYVRSGKGPVTSQGESIHRCNQARSLGFDGTGVKVGVISTGITGLAASQAAGELGPVQVVSAARPEDEGTAMLEVIADCAPGATLMYADHGTTSLFFVQSVNALRDAGAQIIVDDIYALGEPFFEDGLTALNDRNVGTSVLRITLAGNLGLGHYRGFFDPGSFDAALAGTRHNFGDGDESLRVEVPAGVTATLVLQWTNPFGAAVDDYDLCVRQPGGALLTCSNATQDGNDDPVEFVGLTCPASAPAACAGDVQITRFAGGSQFLVLYCDFCDFKEFNNPLGSIFGHSAVPEVLTVAAAPASDPATIEPYSSWGPATVFFPAIEVRPKPDLTGIDCVATGRPEWNPFCGTSAAAPHVAAVAAILLQKMGPDTSVRALAGALTATATRLGSSEFSFGSGYGRADALSAVQSPLLDPGLVAAVLPTSRSVQVGATATIFAAMGNTGFMTAKECKIAPVTNLPGTFVFQPTDSATNQVTGTPDTPFSLTGRAIQTLVLAFTPSAPFAPTEVQLSFTCNNATPAPVFAGLDTVLLSASSTPVPDVVALAATANNDGIVDVAGTNGTGVFAVATVNVGAGGSITAAADTGVTALPIALTICETEAATGACRGGPGPSVTTTIDAGATATFGLFVTGQGTVPFDPTTNRIFVRFKDAGGVTRGSTSVAVRTQ
jgi:subtilisin family serine protease